MSTTDLSGPPFVCWRCLSCLPAIAATASPATPGRGTSGLPPRVLADGSALSALVLCCMLALPEPRGSGATGLRGRGTDGRPTGVPRCVPFRRRQALAVGVRAATQCARQWPMIAPTGSVVVLACSAAEAQAAFFLLFSWCSCSSYSVLLRQMAWRILTHFLASSRSVV